MAPPFMGLHHGFFSSSVKGVCSAMADAWWEKTEVVFSLPDTQVKSQVNKADFGEQTVNRQEKWQLIDCKTAQWDVRMNHWWKFPQEACMASVAIYTWNLVHIECLVRRNRHLDSLLVPFSVISSSSKMASWACLIAPPIVFSRESGDTSFNKFLLSCIHY